jgi:hypothetical protein
MRTLHKDLMCTYACMVLPLLLHETSHDFIYVALKGGNCYVVLIYCYIKI